MWRIAQDHVASRLFEYDARVPLEAVRKIYLQEKNYDMLKLLAVLSVTLYHLEGTKPGIFEIFLLSLPRRLLRFREQHPRGIEERFAETALKYDGLCDD